MNTDTLSPMEPAHALPEAARSQTHGAGPNPPAPTGRAVIHSASLLGSATAVEIEHLGQIYRLQTTRAGKLILTK